MSAPSSSADSAPERKDEPASATAPGCRQPRPDTLSADDDALLHSLAVKIQRRGLSAPALLWLDSLRPVSFLCSKFMHFMNPFVHMIIKADSYERLAVILEERAHLERLLLHIEAVSRKGKDRGGDDS
jgi:hypothetical protein